MGKTILPMQTNPDGSQSYMRGDTPAERSLTAVAAVNGQMAKAFASGPDAAGVQEYNKLVPLVKQQGQAFKDQAFMDQYPSMEDHADAMHPVKK